MWTKVGPVLRRLLLRGGPEPSHCTVTASDSPHGISIQLEIWIHNSGRRVRPVALRRSLRGALSLTAVPSAQVRERRWGWQVLVEPSVPSVATFEGAIRSRGDVVQYPNHFPFVVRYCDEPVPMVPLHLSIRHPTAQLFGISSDLTDIGWMTAEIVECEVVETFSVGSDQCGVHLVGIGWQGASAHIKGAVHADLDFVIPQVLRSLGIAPRSQFSVSLGTEHHAVHSQFAVMIVVDENWYATDAGRERGRDILRWQVCGSVVGGLTRIMGPDGAETQLAMRIWLYLLSVSGEADDQKSGAAYDIVAALRDAMSYYTDARDAAVYSNAIVSVESLRLNELGVGAMRRVLGAVIGKEVSSAWVRARIGAER